MSAGLRFFEKQHKYTCDGRPIPGVTTLIGKGLPKPAIPYWAAKSVAEFVADKPDAVEQMRQMGRGPMVAALKAVPWEKRDQAAVRGTDVHALAEQLVHGAEVEVPEHLVGYVNGYVDWLNAEQPEPIWTERPVASRKWWYAGTFDLLARLRGELWMLDVKTSNGVYGETGLQLAAYAGAEWLVDLDGNEQPMPHIDRLGVLHVQDGETHLYPITDPEAAWRDWLHVAWVGKSTDRIKTYLGDELMPEPADGTAA